MSGLNGGQWSTSYRWMGVTRSDAKGLVQHDLRDPQVTQSNPQVDASRTAENVALIADADGVLAPLHADEDGVEMVMALLDRHTAGAKKNTRRYNVKKKNPATGRMELTGEVREVEVGHRSDASVMVEVVMQLDPEFTGTGRVFDEDGRPVWAVDDDGVLLRDERGHRVPQYRSCAEMTPGKRAETSRLLDVMIAEAIAQHPSCRLLYVTKHFDETAPHVQMAFVPFTTDGCINFKKVMGEGARSMTEAKAVYEGKHDRMREALLAHGYDATMERVSDGKGHLRLPGYKRLKDREARLIDDDLKLNDWDLRLRDEQAGIRIEREALAIERSALEAREQVLTEREAELPRQRRKARAAGMTEGLAAADERVAAQVRMKWDLVVGPAQQHAADLMREAADEKARAVQDAEQYFADAKASALRRLTQLIADARESMPVLFEEFLDTPTGSSVTPRRTFERFVDRKLEEFESRHDVVGVLDLEEGDREAFVADGGKQLAQEVDQLKREKSYGA